MRKGRGVALHSGGFRLGPQTWHGLRDANSAVSPCFLCTSPVGGQPPSLASTSTPSWPTDQIGVIRTRVMSSLHHPDRTGENCPELPLFLFLLIDLFILRETETEHELGRGRERERERGREIQNLKQVPGSELSAQTQGGAGTQTRTHEPGDHDLSQSQVANRLSHTGAPKK